MARRDFRQFGLADSIVQRRGKKTAWLERLDAAIDWAALETIVEGIYGSREGGLAYPLLTYVKLLLLQQWHGLSDEGLEAAVDDRLSFRRFAGIPLAESVPDHSSIWRFREELARRDLAARLLAEVNRQLDAKGLIPAIRLFFIMGVSASTTAQPVGSIAKCESPTFPRDCTSEAPL